MNIDKKRYLILSLWITEILEYIGDDSKCSDWAMTTLGLEPKAWGVFQKTSPGYHINEKGELTND